MNRCIDCKKEIYKTSTYCKSCAKKGENNPSWKGEIFRCVDCNNILSAKHCKRCDSCSRIYNGSKLKGKNNPYYNIGKKHWNYKGGEERFSNCIDCNKKTSSTYYKRCNECLFKIRKGKNHPTYIDGRSYKKYPKEFNKKLKEKIRKRDNYICQNCNMTEEEHLETYNRVLNIHHIDYNKENCIKENLISTCLDCNLLANKDRVYWEEFYSKKVRKEFL